MFLIFFLSRLGFVFFSHSWFSGCKVRNRMILNYVCLFFCHSARSDRNNAVAASQNFTIAVPSFTLGVCYIASVYLLTFAIRTISVPIVFATWSELGIFTTAIASMAVFKQTLSLPVMFDLFLIVVGAVWSIFMVRSIADLLCKFP